MAKKSSQLKPQLPAVVKEKFPTKLIWMPAGERPSFPGIISSAMLETREHFRGAEAVLKQKEPYLAMSYMPEGLSMDDVLLEGTSFKVGCVARVLKAARSHSDEYTDSETKESLVTQTRDDSVEGQVQVFLLRALRRMEIEEVLQRKPYMVVKVRYFVEDEESVFGLKDSEIKSYLSLIIAKVKELIRLDAVFVEEMKLFVAQHALSSPVLFLNLISGHLTVPSPVELQSLLSIRDLKERMLRTIYFLQKEVEIFHLRKKIDDQVQKEVSKQQRQFFLREQLKYIKKELGLESDEKTVILEKFEARMGERKLSAAAEKVVKEEIRKLSLYDTRSPEYGMTLSYVEWLLALPWGIDKKVSINLQRMKRVLNTHHYGMGKVKERILEFMAVEKLKGETSGSILCFLGPPGVGKTSLGKSIAQATGRDFYRFSLGGMRDEAEIKGHRRTYVGAMPGKFIQALKAVSSRNAVIMLDEIDKLSSSFRGDPASALLEVLDKEQNDHFLDHYLDVPFDLSKVLFIATANQLETIPLVLLDRMEVVELSGYILEEKEIIARRHLLPKIAVEHGLKEEVVSIGDSVLRVLISQYARESGVRSLEKALAQIFRKAVYEKMRTHKDNEISKAKKVTGKGAASRKNKTKQSPKDKTWVITETDLKKYLGREVFREELSYKTMLPGVVCGLAWTQMGGTPLYIEVIDVSAQEKGGVRLTGNLGEVMMESAEIAHSYIRSFIEPRLTREDYDALLHKELHIHVPAGATPKDGPSAGAAMATAILSRVTNYPMSETLAMTGELTLTGQVLPVGGIREKMVAAKRAGKINLVLPAGNRADFQEIPMAVRKGLKPVFVDHFKQIFKKVFPATLLQKQKNAGKKTASQDQKLSQTPTKVAKATKTKANKAVKKTKTAKAAKVVEAIKVTGASNKTSVTRTSKTSVAGAAKASKVMGVAKVVNVSNKVVHVSKAPPSIIQRDLKMERSINNKLNNR